MWAVVFDPTRADVAFACGADGYASRLRRGRDGRFRCVERLAPHDRAVRHCAVSPCGRALATASFDGTGFVYARHAREASDGRDGDGDGVEATDDERWRRACCVEGHESEVKSCAWSPSGSLLATCGRDRTVWIWESHGDDDFECVAALYGHGGDVKRVTWHPTEDVLVSVSYDEACEFGKRTWTVTIGRACACSEGGREGWRRTRGRCGARVRAEAASDGRAGTRCVTCGGDGALIVWNGVGFCNTELEYGTKFACGHDRAVLSCSWGKMGSSPRGGDNSIRIYGEVDGEWRQIARAENAHDDDVNHVEWSPHDSSLLISASDDGTIKAWRFRASEE